MTNKEGTSRCSSDNVALRPMVKAHLINPLAKRRNKPSKTLQESERQRRLMLQRKKEEAK
jgi:hypothetical protein